MVNPSEGLIPKNTARPPNFAGNTGARLMSRSMRYAKAFLSEVEPNVPVKLLDNYLLWQQRLRKSLANDRK